MRKVFKSEKGQVIVEFAICGLLFIGFVMAMVALGIWKYNVSKVEQAARIAAYNVAVTNNTNEAQQLALTYLNKTLIACPVKGAAAYGSSDNGHGVAEAYMTQLFPGYQKLIDPRGTSSVNGSIHIRREATRAREYRFRPGSRNYFN
ncbi:MAG: TadE/TadG family type IV pilus assembly protein [Bacillota bacterium]